MSGTPELTTVAVVGAGYMGLGIAQVLAGAGCSVTLLDADAEHTLASVQRLRELVGEHERANLVRPGTASLVVGRMRAATSIADALSDVDMVIEAVPEHLDVKAVVWRQIDEHTSPETVLASNTSSIPIGAIARSVRDPRRVVGMHWFNPAPFVPGIEVIPGPETSDDVVTRVVELARRAGKTPVVVADSPGFVANRLQFALFREAATLVEEGVADAEAVDAVVRSTFGYRLPFFGPFAIADMAGLDVYGSAFEVLEKALGERFSPPASLVSLVEQGALGAKTGRGFLDLTAAEIEQRARTRDVAYQELGRLMCRIADASAGD